MAADRHAVLTSAVHIAAGSTSGLITTVAFQPLEVVKTRRQQSFGGRLVTLRSIAHSQGYSALWRGTVPSLYRTVPGVGLYFWLVSSAKAACLGVSLPSAAHETLAPSKALAVSLACRSVVCVALMPITVVKTRVESGLYNYKGTWSALITIAKQERPRSLYTGLTATLLRDVPYAGLYYLMYEQAKSVTRMAAETHGMSMAGLNLVAGIFCGFTATVLTHVPDVVRTQLQLRNSHGNSFTRALAHIYQTQGFKGLFAGFAPRATRRALMSAVSWGLYEQLVAGWDRVLAFPQR